MKTLFGILLLFLLLTQTHFTQWVNIGPSGLTVYSLAASGTNVFAGTYNEGVYISTDNGQTWEQSDLKDITIMSILVVDSAILAGAEDGAYSSTDNGKTWIQTSLNNLRVNFLALEHPYLFAGTDNGVYISLDKGKSWTQTSLNNLLVFSLAVQNSNIFAGTERGIFRSTDNSLTWTQTTLDSIWIKSVAVNGSNVFAGTWEEGIYTSTDNGENWTHSWSLYDVPVILVNYSNIYATSNGVYVSENDGNSWKNISQGLPSNYFVLSLAFSDEYVFAGMVLGYSIWRRPLDQLVTSISNETILPDKFSLSQNFPNPFNPSTKIGWQSPVSSHQTLKVYDVLGNEIATLVDEFREAGKYEVEFSSERLTSGIYLYKLQVGNSIETKKMILMK